MKKLQIILALLVTLNLSSCTSDPVTSYNVYTIDNQSSIDLFYKTGSGIDERTIEISRSSLKEIDKSEFDGDDVVIILPEEFFSTTDNESYLLKEVNGNLINALQLNTIGQLNWSREMVNEFTYNHTLVVTDGLLN